MIDFFSQLRLHGMDVRQHTSDPDEYKINCPFCLERGRGRDFGYRLGFNIKSGLGHCFRCNWSSRKALVEILRATGSVGSYIDEVRATDFTGETRERPKPVKFPTDWTLLKNVDDDDPLWGPPRRYIMRRGVTQKQLRIHEVGATRDDDYYRCRVVFPVRQGKMLCGFVGRDWTGENQMKYKNSRGVKVVYNLRKDYPEGTKRVILFEGVLKALAGERALAYTVCCAASLGNAVTPGQTLELKEFDEVVLFPDPDLPGIIGFMDCAENMEHLVKRVSMVWPWPKKQADEMSQNEILEVIENRRWVSPVLRLKIRSEMRFR